ncbi:MAG: spore coat protein U domain-containing protein [Thermodesulfobacteriota bacterium]
MKKIFCLTLVLGLVLLFTRVGLAGDTATVTVSATVVGTCNFKTGGTISFTLDPSVGGNVNGSVSQPTFWCTKGASYTISDDDGLHKSGTTHQMKHATLEEFIPYSFTYTTTGTGQGKGTTLTMDISSLVKEADYINASAGSYSDTVTLTITP